MEVGSKNLTGGSLHISGEVLAKIAQLAAKEIDGVADIVVPATGVKGFINKLAPANPITVEMKNDVADVTISVVVENGVKIPELCEKIQENVKNSIQSMTQISVAKVNIVITGIEPAHEVDELV